MSMQFHTRVSGAVLILALFFLSCDKEIPTVGGKVVGKTAAVGSEPVPTVRLFENHSTALIEWARAGVRDRVLVHLDGHSDFDWLPDNTVARIAAARPDELPGLELHPYTMDNSTLSRFGIWNFIYPAARMGIVRELVWVVPDGTLKDQSAVSHMLRDILVGKMEMVAVNEALALRGVGKVIQGEILGVPLIVCEIGDLPVIHEPVLLDIDLDYFSTVSAVTMEVTTEPWITPRAVIDILEKKQISTDLVTLSFSTIGGFLPPGSRWLGPAVVRELRHPDSAPPAMEMTRMEAFEKLLEQDYAGAADHLNALTAAEPENACGWYCYSQALTKVGNTNAALDARRQAIALDPILAHDELFEGDRLWFNREYEAALASYERYLETFPAGPFSAWALRRKGGCLMRLHRDADAIRVYRKVVEQSEDHADSLLDLGILLRENGKIDEALQYLGRAREALPERSDYALALGTTLVLAGRIEEGTQELANAARRKPTSIRIRRNLALALMEQNRIGDAAGQISVALRLDPSNPSIREIARRLQQAGVNF